MSTRPSLSATSPALSTELGRAKELYQVGEYEEAGQLWTAVLLQAREQSDSVAETEALTWLGLRAWRIAEFTEARRFAEEALRLKVEYGLLDSLFRSYNALGLLAWDEGRLADAADHFQHALAEGRRLAQPRMIAAGTGNLGLIQNDLGDFRAAREAATSLLEAGRALGVRRYEANGLTNLGTVAVNVGDPAAAIDYLEQARAVYQELGDPNEQIAVAQLYKAYMDLGQPATAFAMLDTATILARESGERDEEARNVEALASFHHASGNLLRARDLYDSARTRFSALGLEVEAAATYRALAQVHAVLGDLSTAKRHATNALAAHRDAGDRYEELLDLLILAEILHLSGHRSAAWEHLAAARAIAEEFAAPTTTIAVALADARMADREGDYAHVIDVLETLLASDVPIHNPADRAAVDAILARAYAQLGDSDAAIRVGRRGLEEVERIREGFRSSSFRTSFLGDKASLYGDLVQVLVQEGRLKEAFEVMDAARGRALVERLTASHATARASKPMLQTLVRAEEALRTIRELSSRVAESEIRLYGERWEGEEAVLAKRLERTRTEGEALLVESMERDGDGTAVIGVRRIPVDQIQRALADDEALLEYLVTDDRVWLLVVRSRSMSAFDAPTASTDLVRQIRVARGLLSQPAAPVHLVDRLMEELYDRLLRPAAEAGALTGVGRLILVPHGVLVYLPFAALRDRTTGSYVVQHFETSFLPTASALPVLRRRATRSSESHSAASLFAPLGRNLPATRDEVRGIRHVFREARLAMNSRATELRLRDALAQPRIVHTATHAVMNQRNPMFSGIRMAGRSSREGTNDGRLEVHEVLGLTIRSPLVFLSGCETGVGPAWSTRYARGDDFVTLAQAFLYAGADHVIATLWRIQDRGAAAFAQHFYQALEGSSPAEALAMAQRLMLADPEHRAPYYWAAYQLAGRGTW